MWPFMVARPTRHQIHTIKKRTADENKSPCVQCHGEVAETKFGLPGLIHWDERCGQDLVKCVCSCEVRCRVSVYGLCLHLCGVYVWEWTLVWLGWLMASVCMCENAPGPVSMLMSSSRWERGGWTNNEQTHQQPYNLERPNRSSTRVHFLTQVLWYYTLMLVSLSR